ncbi:uncharacterized protein H6S33_000989 [Morchella sextelata]|uniref:uncharacterized protein n=1 Tax=Morchella sextelata TaxID=1174677 RepID=UPI001D052AC2|nr:uncharacterized protein H6S33_000989 [Morchella sextelata]KAH0615353.1 hypothetical protein H6S33_000989 [Morchella sextelata]
MSIAAPELFILLHQTQATYEVSCGMQSNVELILALKARLGVLGLGYRFGWLLGRPQLHVSILSESLHLNAETDADMAVARRGDRKRIPASKKLEVAEPAKLNADTNTETNADLAEVPGLV